MYEIISKVFIKKYFIRKLFISFNAFLIISCADNSEYLLGVLLKQTRSVLFEKRYR